MLRSRMKLFGIVLITMLIFSTLLPSILFAVPGKGKSLIYQNEMRETREIRNVNTVQQRILQSGESTEPVNKPNKFVITGTVVSVEGNNIVIRVKKGSGAARDLAGINTLVMTDSATKYSGKLDITKIYPGGRITVSGVAEEDSLLARLVAYSPKRFVINGQVTFIGEGYFTVKVKAATKTAKEWRGQGVNILYNSSTKFISSESTVGPTTLTVGAYVNVMGYFNGENLIARTVVIKAKKILQETGEPTITTPTSLTTPTVPTTDTPETTEGGSSSATDTAGGAVALRSVWQFVVSLTEQIKNFFSSLL